MEGMEDWIRFDSSSPRDPIMPSGAKKRKAAKKKKEKGASNSSTQSHGPGDGDLKVSSPISEHSDEYHPITEEEIEKNKEHPSSVRSVDKIGEATDKVHKSSSSSSGSRSSSSGSSGSSSDDESSNSIEKNVVMIESNDPSDLPELLGEEHAAILEDQKLEVTVTPSTAVFGVPPFEDHNSRENEVEKSSSADQIDLVEVKKEGEACNNSVTDPSSSSINQDKKVSLVEEEMGEEKYIVLEENTTDIITESKLKIDQSVSNTIETSFQEHKGKDHQSTSVAGSVEKQQAENSPPKVLQRTSWASCCGLFELFSGTNR